MICRSVSSGCLSFSKCFERQLHHFSTSINDIQNLHLSNVARELFSDEENCFTSTHLSDEIFSDDFYPPSEERQMIFSLHQMLKGTEHRLKQIEEINSKGLFNQMDHKMANIQHLFNTGGYQLINAEMQLNQQIKQQIITPMNELLDEYEFVEKEVVGKQYLEWFVNYSASEIKLNTDSNANTIAYNYHWPQNLRSPVHEIGNCWWNCELRLISFTNEENSRRNYYKLGLFFAPKRIQQMSHVIALNAVLEVCLVLNISNGEKEIKNIEFEVDANFISIEDQTKEEKENAKIISWGKFIPELQDIFDRNTAIISYENVTIDISMRVRNQTVTYK